MNTRLTLSIDKRIIEKSKKYAASQNSSLSDLIESYLISITSKSVESIEVSSRIRALRGSFKAPAGFNYKKILKEVKRKYG
ncbi:MAG: DUF6364 family protein [Saprospiraceae bacterium]